MVLSVRFGFTNEKLPYMGILQADYEVEMKNFMYTKFYRQNGKSK